MANEKRRLIDADALKDKLMNLEASGGHKYYRKGMDDTLHFHVPNIIDNAPSVDAVEVVRCKDCKHRVEYFLSGRFVCKFHQCTICGSANYVKDDGYCSDGERKDNG